MDIIPICGFEMSPPAGSTTVSTSATPGNMAPGTYSYVITNVTRYGETTPSAITAIGTVVPQLPASTGALALSNIPTVTTNYLTSRNLYRTSVGNVAPYRKVATLQPNVTTYLDTLPDGSLGVVAPTVNTAASVGKIYGTLLLEHPVAHAVNAVSATGNNRATAQPITSEYAMVAVPIPNAGIVLPFIDTDRTGLQVTIVNTSVNSLNIYPENGLTTINGAAPGTPFALPTGDTAQLIATSGTTWVTFAGGSGGGSDPVGAPLTSGYIWLGSGANIAAAVALSGDVSITSAGATSVNTIKGVLIHANAGTGNLSFGAGANNGAGTSNITFGAAAGATLTTGTGNIVIGPGADVGADAISSIVIGNGAKNGTAFAINNVLIGTGAGNITMISDDCVGIGTLALAGLTNGYRHVVMGTNAGMSLTDATNNVLLGYRAGRNMTGGFENTAVGSMVMENHINGGSNVAFGMQALRSNTGGVNNAAFGWYAVSAGATGIQNTGIGNEALRNVTGNLNTGLGYRSGLNLAAGTNNVLLGHNTGLALTSGEQNVLVGGSTNCAAAAVNTVGVGHGVTTTVDNEIVMGNNLHTYFSLGGQYAIPILPVPSNYYASLSGVKVGGLYRSRNNGSGPVTTNAITASFVSGGTTLTVTAVTSATIAPGQALTAGVGLNMGPPATYIVSQLTGAAGDVGTYEVSNFQAFGVTVTQLSSDPSLPDIVYIRTF